MSAANQPAEDRAADDDLADIPPMELAPPAAPSRPPGPGFWMAVAWTVLLLLAQGSVAVFASIVGAIAGLAPDQLLQLILPAGSAAILIAAVALTGALFGDHAPQILAARPPAWQHVSWAVLLVGPLAACVQEMAAWAQEVLPSFPDDTLIKFAQGPIWLILLAGCMLPGVGEEIFFRGFLGRGLLARYGLWWGTLLGSFLFALVHINPPQMVGILGIGIALQLSFLATRSIFVPMLIHALNNTLSFAMTRYETLSDVEHLPPQLVAAGIVAVALLAALFYRGRAEWVLPDGNIWSPGYPTAEAPPPGIAEISRKRPSALLVLTALIGCAAFYTLAAQIIAAE